MRRRSGGSTEDMRDALRVLAGAVVVAMAGVAGACESLTDTSIRTVESDAIEVRTAPGLVFLTLKIEPEAHMDALYEGTVSVDDAGCVRLDGPDAHTVIWPKGYAFEERSGGFAVLDGAGAEVGALPGDFRLAGGEVEVLHEGLGFTSADQTLASTHCPGRFWIGRPD